MLLSEYYPHIESLIEPDKDLRGEFTDIMGITLHYTGARSTSSTLTALKSTGYRYHILIERDGSVHQLAKLTHRVNHAGRALWRGYSPNKYHIAVALESWGFLDQHHKSWAGTFIPPEERREFEGYTWDKCTEIQEVRLLAFLTWAIENGVPVNGICGHDECCLPFGRKKDPGGILWLPTPAIREKLLDSKQILKALKTYPSS